MASVSGERDKYGKSEEGQCGHEDIGSGSPGQRTVSGDEGGNMSAGDRGLSGPRQNGQGRNFKMSSDDAVSESGKQA
jgi:hypothetical protein